VIRDRSTTSEVTVLGTDNNLATWLVARCHAVPRASMRLDRLTYQISLLVTHVNISERLALTLLFFLERSEGKQTNLKLDLLMYP
jgi:hypothetical protein